MATDAAKKAWKAANKQAMVTYMGTIYEDMNDHCWICEKEGRVSHLNIVRLRSMSYPNRAPWVVYLPPYGSAWATVTGVLNLESTGLVCTKCLLSLQEKFHRIGIENIY